LRESFSQIGRNFSQNFLILGGTLPPVAPPLLTLFRNFSNQHIRPLIDTVLHRFCSQILPQIHYKINMLYLESFIPVEHILLAVDYPKLHSLALRNMYLIILFHINALFMLIIFVELSWYIYETSHDTKFSHLID
jgi:hypothetical protein